VPLGSGFVVALLRNLRKTECGSGQFLVRFAVRAAPFALPAGRGSVAEESGRVHTALLLGILKNADLEAYKKYLAVKYR